MRKEIALSSDICHCELVSPVGTSLEEARQSPSHIKERVLFEKRLLRRADALLAMTGIIQKKIASL